jgi:hypothetical protein
MRDDVARGRREKCADVLLLAKKRNEAAGMHTRIHNLFTSMSQFQGPIERWTRSDGMRSLDTLCPSNLSRKKTGVEIKMPAKALK